VSWFKWLDAGFSAPKLGFNSTLIHVRFVVDELTLAEFIVKIHLFLLLVTWHQ